MDDLISVLGGNAALAMPSTMDAQGIAPFVAPIALNGTYQIGASASVFNAATPQGYRCILKAYRQAYDRAGAGALEMEKVRFEVKAAQTAAHLPGGLAPACLATRRSGALIYTIWGPAKGESLDTFLAPRAMPPLQSRYAMAQALIDAVAQIHDAGLLHLDLKPEHIFIEKFPPYGVQIIDWAQARYIARDQRPDTLMFATPAYTRPARLAGATACRQDDWFAVARILVDTLNVSSPLQDPV